MPLVTAKLPDWPRRRPLASTNKGRPRSIREQQIAELKGKGIGPTEIARTLKIGRASVYRVLAVEQGRSAAG